MLSGDGRYAREFGQESICGAKLSTFDQQLTSLPGRSALPVTAGMTASKQTMWFLSGRMYPNEPIHHVPIHTSPFVIGRQTNAALCLPSKTVSSAHAEIVERENSLVLRDLGSTNGTFINGKRISGTVELMPDDLVQFGDVAFRILRQSTSLNTMTQCEDVLDQAMALVQFDRLMSEEAVVPHYQPIVTLPDEQIVSFEVLVRSNVAGLEGPAAMFSAATRLSLETKLSQMIRWKAVQQTAQFDVPPHLFLNTHPVELQEPGLLESMRLLRELGGSQEITLEIHEKAVTDAKAMKELRAALVDIDIRLAFDDFGSGQARLREISEVHPDYVKFDMSLLRSIDEATAEHRRMIATLVTMTLDIGVVPLAEGLETTAERDVCVEFGFQLGQGFYFGRPAAVRTLK